MRRRHLDCSTASSIVRIEQINRSQRLRLTAPLVFTDNIWIPTKQAYSTIRFLAENIQARQLPWSLHNTIYPKHILQAKTKFTDSPAIVVFCSSSEDRPRKATPTPNRITNSWISIDKSPRSFKSWVSKKISYGTWEIAKRNWASLNPFSQRCIKE